MNLTQNEMAILKASRNNEFGDAFDGETPWVFAVIAVSGLSPEIARGTISSLVQKGIVIVEDYEGKGNPDDMIFIVNSDFLQSFDALRSHFNHTNNSLLP